MRFRLIVFVCTIVNPLFHPFIQFNALSDPAFEVPYTNEGDLSVGNDDTATHAFLQQTINPNIFTLSIPTASLDNPAGEIQVSTVNQYAASTSAVGLPESAGDFNLELQNMFAEYGIASSLSGNLPQEEGVTSAQGEELDQRNSLAQFVEELAQMNARAQEQGMMDVVAGYSLNMPTSFDGIDFGSFIAPASLMGALPSPPESSAAGSQNAPSPFDVPTVQPTNLGASGSGQGQMNQSHLQMFAQGPILGQDQNYGEASHPTPPVSAGSAAPSPYPTHDDAQSRHPAHSAPGYVPPSGAANATRRRAAGSWRPPT